MPELTFIRHSLPEIEPGKEAALWHLSEEGRQRCLALAERLAEGPTIDVIATSPEPKAHETAGIVAARLGIPFSTVDDLREHERSRVRLLPRENFERKVAEFFARPGEPVFGVETADEAHRRFAAAVDGLIAAHPGKSIALVTHGTVLTLFLSRALGMEPFRLWRGLKLPGFVTLALPGLEPLRWEL